MSWNDKRPMSPHLQVYKLPFTALLSIGHRAAGVANTFALILIVWVLARASGTPDDFKFIGALLDSWFGYLALFGLTLSLYYHLCNGIRHFYWDIGKGFEMEAANNSGKICLAAAAALTVITWIVASVT